MGNIKRFHSAAFKAKVALDLVRETDTTTALCSKYGIHPTQAGLWKQQAIAGLEAIFSGKPKNDLKAKDDIIGELYKQIGQLKVELDWVKKRWAPPKKERLKHIDPLHPTIPITRQCQLLDVSRSSVYYESVPVKPETAALMNRIDEIYTNHPYYGSPKITAQLKREEMVVNHKKIERLMRIMGLAAIVPRKNTSQKHPEHPVFPYLLKDIAAHNPNHIWGTDITYVRAHGVWFYLVAVIDWFSRYVLAWRLSKSMTPGFCVEALQDALAIGTPLIHNSDQGSQFTSADTIGALQNNPALQISMDGRGRCFDNIFTERLWRTVKYEEVYLHDYQSYDEARTSMSRYFITYNTTRLHQALGYKTPAEVYFSGVLPEKQRSTIAYTNSLGLEMTLGHLQSKTFQRSRYPL